MKMIRITTANEISAVEFPGGTYSQQNKELRQLIGPQCDLYEHVRPKRLYEELKGSNTPAHEEGSAVGMLIDEEGHFHGLDINLVGSWLYESDKHGYPILGDILIVGEYFTGGGMDFSGLSDEQFDWLYPQLQILAEAAKNGGGK